VTRFWLPVAVLLTGLLAGVYYAFAVGVAPGLGQLPDDGFVAAMNRVNQAIVNPAFMLSFLGAPVVTLVAVLVARDRTARPRWLLAGLLLNVAGLLITLLANVPLNDDLLAGGGREAYELTWLCWNVARTVVTTAACACLIVAMTPRRG